MPGGLRIRKRRRELDFNTADDRTWNMQKMMNLDNFKNETYHY